jgi:hypothetical protein
MKRAMLWVIGGIVSFLALSVLIPGDRKADAVELCGDGRELKSATGGSKTDREYYDLACDHAKAQSGYDALYREQHGQ